MVWIDFFTQSSAEVGDGHILQPSSKSRVQVGTKALPFFRGGVVHGFRDLGPTLAHHNGPVELEIFGCGLILLLPFNYALYTPRNQAPLATAVYHLNVLCFSQVSLPFL